MEHKLKVDKSWDSQHPIKSMIRHRIWREKNPAKVKVTNKKYRKTEKGRMAEAKVQAKRIQKYNWILMFENPFADSVLVEYHHITDAYVVAIPKDLHQLYNGKYHREKTMEIVKQIYLNEVIA